MAKRTEGRVFNVSVVGLSGTEKEKGITGIGKSCLCSRFIRPHANDYSTEHISVISQSDFGGRVINNDHFLYWGQVSKTSDEGLDVTFEVVEQTEFIDDSSFLPFKIGKTDSYMKRAANIRLQSAEKLMYICKNQLGVENDYEQRLLPEGRFNVDGFLCLFDVSDIPQRSIEWQIDYTVQLLNNLVKTKKPVVLATTKNDEGHDGYIKEAEKLVNRKEFRGIVHLVETSAHSHINIDQAFLTLAHLIDRTKGRPKIVPYSEAVRARNEIVTVALEAFKNLIRIEITDHRTSWTAMSRKLGNHSDFSHFLEVRGTDEARKIFRLHQRSLKVKYVQSREDDYLEKLQVVIRNILPDLNTIADRSWPSCVRMIQRREDYKSIFVQLPEGISWQDSEFLDSNDGRIPVEILQSDLADMLYRNHLNALRAEQRRLEMKRDFKQVLSEHSSDVTPGKPLKDATIFLLGHECYTSLSEEDKGDVYDTYQRELRDGAKQEFQELLWESVHLFLNPAYANFLPSDVETIKSKLQDDPRFSSLARLEHDRKMLLLSHLSFLQNPSRANCPFREGCTERAVQKVLITKAHRPQSWNKAGQFVLDSSDHKINMVLLGAEGLPDEMVNEVRCQCFDDEFTMDSKVYSLDYRPIDGDVSLPQNSLCTAEFLPHGCFVTYDSMDSLEFIRDCLCKTLLSRMENEEPLPFHGLPTVIVLAWDPNLSDDGLEMLREEGRTLSEQLQCPFIDIPSSQMSEEEGRRYHPEQVTLAIRTLINSIEYRSGFVQPWHIAESLEPDLRILMCMMCGDHYNVELPLMPLLNHQCCYVTSDRYPALTLEAYLDDSNVKIEVTIVSYHGASIVRNELFHGYILVYHTKRKASYANLSLFASHIPVAPCKILAITDQAGMVTQNDLSHQLLLAGRAVADRLDAEFWSTMNDANSDSSFYTPLFREAWERKLDTEEAYEYAQEHHVTNDMSHDTSVLDHMTARPPAVLPKSLGHYSLKHSDHDIEPVYDRLRFDVGSDSDQDQVSSSTSPCPPPVDYSPYSLMDNDVYSEITPYGDQEKLIKRSPAGSRRGAYSDKYRKSFPGAYVYREDSTDTDSSIRSPNLRHSTVESSGSDYCTPHYQFRKSNSMRLALKENVTDQSDNPETDQSFYSTASPDRKATPPSTGKLRPRALEVNKSPGNSLMKVTTKQRGRKTENIYTKAPLATPENIEIMEDYAIVKDALSPVHIQENDYASVQDALPAGKLHRIRSTFRKKNKTNGKTPEIHGGTDSDSELSSLEREQSADLYNRVGRKPTPHKKKHKHRSSDSGLIITPKQNPGEYAQLHVNSDPVSRVRANSPSEGSEGTGDEFTGAKKVKKRRSFRTKKKKPVDFQDPSSPPFSDTDIACAPLLGKSGMDDENVYEPITPREKFEDEEEMDSSGNWIWKLPGFRTDPDKVRRKEEKKKIKEEEKRIKEQQKQQRKLKKKAGSISTPSQSSGILEDLAASDTQPVPLFVIKCIDFLEEEALDFEGLYRVSGSRTHADQLSERFREDPDVDFFVLDIPISAVATSLKGFFADLAEPLVPSHLSDQLIEAAGICVPRKRRKSLRDILASNQSHNASGRHGMRPRSRSFSSLSGVLDRSSRLLALRGIIKKLPYHNFEVLKYIITHLHRVAQKSHLNNMDSKNIAIVWWPTLFRPDIPSLDHMALISRYLEEAVQTMIDQCRFFFYGEHEV